MVFLSLINIYQYAMNTLSCFFSTKSSLVLTLLLIFSYLPLSAQETILEEDTRRLVEILSSDKMRGRAALTPDIDRAAAFIASEFRSAGLLPLSGNEDHLQKFSISRFYLTEVEMILDDDPIDAGNSFGFIYGESIHLSQDNVQVGYVSAKDTFQEAFLKYRESDEPTVVFVDRTHKDLFDRYQGYFGNQPSQLIQGQQKEPVWFVLANPAEQFSVQASTRSEVYSLANVAGLIPGDRTDEIVLFSAHYDHLGVVEPIAGDSIANGANDNASGVSAVIQLAHHFKQMGKTERTLMFVAFTAEEIGGYGSQFFSQSVDPDQIVAMFNIEMIGKPAVSGPNTAWITGYERSTFGELLSKSAEGTIYEFYPDPYPQQNLFYRSDNATLARLGVPAHTISTTPIDVDRDYHQVSDEIETLDLAHLNNTIKAIARAAQGILSGEDTPSRVDPATVD